jgi:photosystem II stability/assembly factor-like uncharacterized protein
MFSFATAATDIDFVDKDSGWAITDGIMKTVDGGSTWSQVSARITNPDSPTEADGSQLRYAQQIDFVDQQTGWLAATGLYRTADGGGSWTRVVVPCAKSPDKGIAYSGRISFVDTHTGWMACAPNYGSVENSSLYKTSDGGETWVALPPPEFVARAISFLDERSGWAGATEGLFATSDGGVTWELATSSAPDDFVVPVPAGGGDLYVLSHGALQASSDGGANWQVVYPPPLPDAAACTLNSLGANVEWTRSADPGPTTTSNRYPYAGNVGGTVTLTNKVAQSCQLTTAEVSARVIDASSQTVAENSDTPVPGAVFFVLAPGAQAKFSVGWSNWCGAAPATPLTLVFEVPDVGEFSADVLGAGGEPVDPPYCHTVIGTGTGLLVSDLWPTVPPANPP